MAFNPVEFGNRLTQMLYDISSFFIWFFNWSFQVPGTNFTVTALGLYTGLGGAFILAIIIRAIIRAVAV